MDTTEIQHIGDKPLGAKIAPKFDNTRKGLITGFHVEGCPINPATCGRRNDLTKGRNKKPFFVCEGLRVVDKSLSGSNNTTLVQCTE